jgi:3-deoxy-manno-octulosonate cytidylyltransferase (CMP-KDO synthetase)
MKTIIVIPARMASTRLPGKPLADIGGTPMIVRVWRQALNADAGPVIVAAAEEEIANEIRRAGGDAVLTDPTLPSGSDRVHQALLRYDPNRQFDCVINLQGDLPALDPRAIRRAVSTLTESGAAIATLGATITNPADMDNPAIVKAVAAWNPEHTRGRALYFTRARAPFGEGPWFHHVGIYAFARDAMDRFIGLPVSPLERREKLEQLRALEAGMHIEIARIDEVPLSVDTPEDLEWARRVLSA